MKTEKTYTAMKKSSLLFPYRIVHENLPKFIDNFRIYEKIKQHSDLLESFNIPQKELDRNIFIGLLLHTIYSKRH